MNYAGRDYTTPDGALHVEFLYVDGGPSFGWRIYVLNEIDYKGRDTSPLATRLVYEDDEDYPYIFWRDPIATLDEAIMHSSFWADITSRYIKSGGDFDEIAMELVFEEATKRLSKGAMDGQTYEYICKILGRGDPSETSMMPE